MVLFSLIIRSGLDEPTLSAEEEFFFLHHTTRVWAAVLIRVASMLEAWRFDRLPLGRLLSSAPQRGGGIIR